MTKRNEEMLEKHINRISHSVMELLGYGMTKAEVKKELDEIIESYLELEV